MSAGRRRRHSGGGGWWWLIGFVVVAAVAAGVTLFVVARVSEPEAPVASSGTERTIYAPYVAITAQDRPTLPEIAEKTGADALHLAFAIGNGEGCVLQWDGTTPLATYQKEIDAAQAAGIELIASTGGANGDDVGVACDTAAEATAQLEKLVLLGIRYLDFDIEGENAKNAEANTIRAQAIAQVQQRHPEVKVSFTLAATAPGADFTATGADNTGSWVAAVDAGVVIDRINLMTMNFGGDVAATDMGRAAIAAVTGLHTQVKAIHGIGDEQAWGMVGLTPMIGVNDVTTEVFGLDDAAAVVDFVRERRVGMLSYWSIGRDRQCGADVTDRPSPVCSGVEQSEYSYASTFAEAVE